MENIDDELLDAAESGDIDAVLEAIENGADVNAAHDDQWTSLMYASKNGYVDIVKLLLQCGADVNASSAGHTSLMLASNFSEIEVMGILLAHGANVFAADEAGTTALRCARVKDDAVAISLLEAHIEMLALNGNINVETSDEHMIF